MRLLAVAGLAIAGAVIGVTVTSAPAGAQYYYPYRPYYAPPPPPPPYYRGYYKPRPYGYRRNPCPPYWTVQDGVCKPYRGY